MNWKDTYPSKWLSADDFDGDVSVVIDSADEEQIRDPAGATVRKQVLTFRGYKKRLILNITNCKMVDKHFGSDTSAWVGGTITLYVAEVSLGSDIVSAIRIRPPELNPEEDDIPFDDDIPINVEGVVG